MSETSSEGGFGVDRETGEKVGRADAVEDAAQAGAPGYSTDTDDPNDVEAVQVDDQDVNLAGTDAGVPVGRADAEEDARQGGA